MSVASWASDVYDFPAMPSMMGAPMPMMQGAPMGQPMGMPMGQPMGQPMGMPMNMPMAAPPMPGGPMPGMPGMGFPQPPAPIPMGGGMPMGAPMPVPEQMSAPVRGVGIAFDQEVNQKTGMAKVYIKRIRPGSSAEQSDSLEVGDMLITVNGKGVYGKPLSFLRTLIPGPMNSVVKLGFQNESGTRTEVELLRTTAKEGRVSNPVFSRPEMVSDTPSIALGDEAGTYNQRAMPGAEEWEKRVDHAKGYVFWVNHAQKKIAYVDPTKPRAPRPSAAGPVAPASYSTLPDAPSADGFDMAATTQV